MRTLPAIVTLLLVGACTPHPPPHGPVPAPPVVSFEPARLLAAIREEYPRATLEPADPRAASHRLTFGPGPSVPKIADFADRFFQRYGALLAAGRLPQPLDAFIPEGKEDTERVYFGLPLRDTGCRRIRLALELTPAGPSVLHRTCDRLRNKPPSYAGRVLPSTATGANDILVRVGSVGGITGPLFGGFVIDRFGDVYEAWDQVGPVTLEPAGFIHDYVATLPPAEVEQFAFDVALSAGAEVVADSEPAAPDAGASVVVAYTGTEGTAVDLVHVDSAAARRAARWARRAVKVK